MYDQNQKQIEQTINKLKLSVDSVVQKESKDLIKTTQTQYLKQQNLIPADIVQEITSLELLTERLSGTMEEKDREFKRAKTIRTDYLNGVDTIQSWLQNAELRIQDRTLEPLQLKEILHKIHQEIGGIQDRMETVKHNGHMIIEKSRKDDEKELIQSTIDQLTQQLNQIRSWLDEKKQQVGDSLDAWTKFMNLYQIVMTWATEKRTFISESLTITTIHHARQKMNDYSVWTN